MLVVIYAKHSKVEKKNLSEAKKDLRINVQNLSEIDDIKIRTLHGQAVMLESIANTLMQINIAIKGVSQSLGILQQEMYGGHAIHREMLKEMQELRKLLTPPAKGAASHRI